MIESFVDLTYRGLSLGRRIKLGQIRPHTGYLELAAPMPVGTAVVLATDDGVTIDATVTWVYEQVTGADRAPGMVVAPVLAAEPAAAWWKARVERTDDDAPRTRITRPRPVTLRPRTQTLQTPPPEGAVADDAPSLAADLAARVAAAAGVAPPAPAMSRTLTGTLPPGLDPSPMRPRAEADGGMRSTGEHVVIDDGHKTVIMQAIDPGELGLEVGRTISTSNLEASAAPVSAADAGDTAAVDTRLDHTITTDSSIVPSLDHAATIDSAGDAAAGDAAGDAAAGDAVAGDGEGEDGDGPEPGAPATADGQPAASRRKRKRRR